LKAAEMLCESLMDENEDMKKEIRELEEEIYEMQDSFRYAMLYLPFSSSK
jgi:mitofilin